MALKFRCENCGKDVIVEFLKVGEIAECKHCFAELIVPEDATETDESTTEGKKVAKGLQSQEVVCTECYSTFNAAPKRSFGGFLKFVCPKCHESVLYPLMPRSRKGYWMLFILMAILAVMVIAEGGIPIPGLVGIGVIFALIKDACIKKRVQAALDQRRKSE